MNYKKIGSFIRNLRNDNNLSQYKLAEMIPISRQAVSKWERGETIPDSSTLVKLSEIFNVTINELLLGQKNVKNNINELQEITLNIVDENNKKDKKYKKLFLIFFVIIITMIMFFLTYYFINSYNSIKVYTIRGNSDNFLVRNGIFVITKEKLYFELGDIEYDNNDITINLISLYNRNDNKLIISSTRKVLITDYYGYNEYFNYNSISSELNDFYLVIKYNDSKTETIHLKLEEDFANDNLIFSKTEKIG